MKNINKKNKLMWVLIATIIELITFRTYAMEDRRQAEEHVISTSVSGLSMEASASKIATVLQSSTLSPMENQFITKHTKRGEIIKISSYKNDIDFVLEKMTVFNMCDWSNFINEQIRLDQENTETTGVKSQAYLGQVPFRESLRYFTPAREIWIAHATPHGQSDIEMCVTVTTEKEFPVVAHMGIFRTVKYFGKKTLGLSSSILHLFAAAAMENYFKKKYMYTAPVKNMQYLLLQNRDALGLLWYRYDSEHAFEAPFNPPVLESSQEPLFINVDGNFIEYPCYPFLSNHNFAYGNQMIFSIEKMKGRWEELT